MYFDFYDRYDSVEAVGSAISRREGVVLSVVVHAAVVLALLLAPRLAWFQATPVDPEAASQQRQPRPDVPRFVVVEPLRDMPAPTPPPKAEASDQDRAASAPKFAERPENPLPFARGETAERVEAAPEERAMGRGPEPEPAPPAAPAEDRTALPEAANAPPAPRRGR